MLLRVRDRGGSEFDLTIRRVKVEYTRDDQCHLGQASLDLFVESCHPRTVFVPEPDRIGLVLVVT
jgi:hypothetical protein